MASRHSGLQKDVLALYRKILREALKKDRTHDELTSASSTGGKQPSFSSLLLNGRRHGESTSTAYAAAEFRRQAETVKRSEFKRVEYMIRKGEKQIKLLRMSGVTTIGGVGSKHSDSLEHFTPH